MAGDAILTAKLDFWVKNSKNVLFIGKHGVGKTAMVKSAFERHKLNYRYFSASTMDPWVDFIGVPREKTEGKMPEQFETIKELALIDLQLGYEWVQNNWKMPELSAKKIVDNILNRTQGATYLDLVRPQSFASGEVEALFFDEFNRSPKKVRNAVMELLQFKSINGYKFPNLKIIWAAINPDDDEDETYDVERLDPAQADRYHIQVEVPYKPNKDWFRQEYGASMADAAIQWWDELADEHKNLVSPRRLQYALDMFRERGDMRDVLPVNTNVSKLSGVLNNGSTAEKLTKLMESKDINEARTYLGVENNYASAIKYILKSQTLMDYFMPLLSSEKLSSIMPEDDKVANYILSNSDKTPIFMGVCKNILSANTNAKLVKKIRKTLQENQDLANAFSKNVGDTMASAKPHFNVAKTGDKSWGNVLANLKVAPKSSPNEKLAVYDGILNFIPQKMSADEALLTLELLTELFTSSGFAFSSSLTAKPFEKLINIVNHAISELNRNTKLGWTEILKKHGSHFIQLLEKLKLSGLGNQIYQPGAN